MEDNITICLTKIVQEIAPDEIDLVPIVVQAFIAGGKKRQELFHQEKNDIVGGFGGIEIEAILPWILNGIMVAAPMLHYIISSGIVEKYLSVVKDLLSITKSLGQKKKIESLPDDPYEPLKQIITLISKELDKAGISADKRDVIVYRLLRILLENPVGGSQVVQAIGGVR